MDPRSRPIEEEVEMEKEKLAHLRGMIARSAETRKELESEMEEMRLEYQKKMDVLLSLSEGQYKRGVTLEAESHKADGIRERHSQLLSLKEELEQQINKVMLDINKSRTNFLKVTDELRVQVKSIYDAIRQEKENKFLMETALEMAQNKEDTNAVAETMRRLEECSARERKNAQKELEEIAKQQEEVEDEIRIRQRELRELKDKHLVLVGRFTDLKTKLQISI